MLRRYFRAVFGDQQSGDRLVAALAPRLPAGDGTVVSLFTQATRTWRKMHVDDCAPAFSARTVIDVLSPGQAVERQAGVLIDVFGLSVDQAATVLDRSAGEVVRLLSATRRGRQTPIGKSVLVVEDEPLIAQHLAQLARKAGAGIVTMARSYDEAMTAAQASPPDIVLCDYDLGAGKTGTDVVRTLSAEYDTLAIFVTAYPNEVLTGSEHEPSFIISKPFRDDVVRAALYFAATTIRPELLAA